MRVKSLKTVSANYSELIKFLQDGIEKKLFETVVTANGFLKLFKSFKFLYLLQTCILIFERIEKLNAELQKTDLNLNESHAKISRLIQSFKGMRDSGYDNLWEKVEELKKKLNVEDAILPRTRKAPRRLENSEVHIFQTSKDYYRKVYFEILDTVITSLEDRFNSETMNFLNLCENFVIGENNNNDLSEIKKFYKEDFDYDRLRTHRDMFLDIARQENLKLTNLKEVVILMKSLYRVNKGTVELISEFSKFIKFLLTIPISTCTAERSFSSLRFLKSYLRSNMKQNRLNHLAIIFIYSDIVETLDLSPIIDKFILKTKQRMATFALSSSMKNNTNPS